MNIHYAQKEQLFVYSNGQSSCTVKAAASRFQGTLNESCLMLRVSNEQRLISDVRQATLHCAWECYQEI
jgi:hypothetical protein